MSNTTNAGRTTAEKITLLTSCLILLSILGRAGWAHVKTGDDPVVIVVEAHLDSVRQEASMYYLPITVTNTGGRPAQDVMVRGELTDETGKPQEAEITLTFLGAGEAENAELVFTSDPRKSEVSIHPVSFVEP